MKFSKEIAGLVVLLLVFIIAGLFVATPDENSSRLVGSELTADPSIYNDRASGSKAFFEWTKRLGYDSETEVEDWSHLPIDSNLLVSVAPESLQGFDLFGAATGNVTAGKLTAADARGVLNWLQPGRTLLLLSSRLPADLYSSRSTSSPSVSPFGGDDDDDSGGPTFGDIIGVTVETAQIGKQTQFTPIQISPLVADVNSIQLSSPDNRVQRPTRDFVTLFASIEASAGSYVDTEPVAIELAEGRGRIIIISDDYFASNKNLGQADNAAFLYNVIATSERPGTKILFDEFHHGDTGTPQDDLWTALGRPLQTAAIQLLLALILVIALLSPRFGAVKRLKQGDVRTSSEYLTSLADLYRRADATIPTLETIYRQFLRDVCQRLALPPDVPLDQLAEIAAKRAKIKPEGIRQLIAACETALDTKRLSAPDLLVLTKQMEMVKRQLD